MTHHPHPTAQQHPHQPQPPVERPEDVDTGFWLWAAALPLMVIGYVVDAVAVDAEVVGSKDSGMVVGVTILFVVILTALVVTFLMLMRSGYRWARSLLTGGGVATMFYTLTNLFNGERPTWVAVVFAVTGIVGSVLIGGGIYLVHRKDSQGFFTR